MAAAAEGEALAFTYNPGAATELDDLRADIGDTNSAAPASARLEDEEIARLLARYGTKPAATLAAARALRAKLRAVASDKTVGGLTLRYSERISELTVLIKDLAVAAAGQAVPYVGGTSVADRSAIESNTDRVEPAFKSGMLDNPRTS